MKHPPLAARHGPTSPESSRRKARRGGYVASLVGALPLLPLAMSISAQSAFAAEPSGAAAASNTAPLPVTAPMTLQCSRLTGSALRYAVSHRYCPTGSGSRVVPQNTVYGSCGSSGLYIRNQNYDGSAIFTESAHSTEGAIASVYYTVNWDNSSGPVGSVSGSGIPLGATWSNADYVYTGVGFVSGVMSGGVVLWWGGVCTIDFPTSATYIY